MSDRKNLVNTIAKMCSYALELENDIATNEMWQWLEDNKTHPDAEDCTTTLDALLTNESSFEGWESFSQVFGEIYRAEFSDKDAEAHVGDEVNMYCAHQSNCNVQWDNLSKLLEAFRQGEDLDVTSIIEMLNEQGDAEHGYF